MNMFTKKFNQPIGSYSLASTALKQCVYEESDAQW